MTQNPSVKKFTNAQWNNMVGLLTPAQIKAFEDAGMVPGAQGPGERGRRDDQVLIFKSLVDAIEPGEGGRKSINVAELLDAGFPASARFTTNWSQLSPGSEVAFDCGWKSTMRTERKLVKGKPSDCFLLIVDLVPLNEEHRKARSEALAKRKPQTPVVETPAPTAPPVVQEQEQLPAEP